MSNNYTPSNVVRFWLLTDVLCADKPRVRLQDACSCLIKVRLIRTAPANGLALVLVGTPYRIGTIPALNKKNQAVIIRFDTQAKHLLRAEPVICYETFVRV